MAYLGKTRPLIGKFLARKQLLLIQKDVELRRKAGKRAPHLAAIWVGDDKASEVYLTKKRSAAETTGIDMTIKKFPSNITQDELHHEIHKLNKCLKTDGIIVQLPLPKRLNQAAATARVHWSKDVDGFHPYNIGRMALGHRTFIPATVAGIITLLDSEIGLTWLDGKRVCIVGRSDHICKPLQMWLQDGVVNRQRPGANTTCIIVHENTPEKMLIEEIRRSDVVVTATNKENMWLTGDYIKEDAIIIDVAFKQCKTTGKLHGDCDRKSCYGIASFITPVPGGVGPLTVSELMKNVLYASTVTHREGIRSEQSGQEFEWDFGGGDSFRRF